jgi:hypothetical protein
LEGLHRLPGGQDGPHSAVITLVGAVNEAEISVMAKDDESIDHIRR